VIDFVLAVPDVAASRNESVSEFALQVALEVGPLVAVSI